MKTLRFSLLIGGTLALLAGVNSASAQTISNPDFTDPTLAPGAYTTYAGPPNTIPSWQNPNIAGVENFNGTGDFSSIPSPGNAAYNDGGAITQDLTGSGSTFSLGSYTLTAYSGWRNDRGSFPGGSIALYDARTNSVVDATSLVAPAKGTFTLTTLNLNIAAGNAALGDQIRVELISNGNSVAFDNINLAFTPAETPEPSTWAMMISGLAVLSFCIRRKAETVK